MLFVRCGNEGISHHPAESMMAADAELARASSASFSSPCRMPECPRPPAPWCTPSWSASSSGKWSSLPSWCACPATILPATARPPPSARTNCWKACSTWKWKRTSCRRASSKANGMISATNLIVRRRFGRGGPTIALNAHGDVVPPGRGWTRDPYGAEIIDDPDHGLVMFGRGVAVSKSDFATYTWALLALIDLEKHGVPLNGVVELHFTYDEEIGGNLGPKRLVEQHLSTAQHGDLRRLLLRGHQRAQRLLASGSRGERQIRPCGDSGHRRRCAGSGDGYSQCAVLTSGRACRDSIRRCAASTHRRSTVGLIQGGINTNVVPDRVTSAPGSAHDSGRVGGRKRSHNCAR